MANEHDQVEVPTWTVDVDGSNKLQSRVGIVLSVSELPSNR
jgi:hypothetical protein